MESESGTVILIVIVWIIILTAVALLFSFSKKKIEKTVSEKKKQNEKGEDIFKNIAIELEKGEIDKGLWVQAEAKSDGNPDRVKSIYIQLRHKKLINKI